MKEQTLRGKNIVITGASSGIGKATALCLAREGANLVLAARRELLLEECALECERFGVKAYYYKTDVTNLDNQRDLFDFALDQLGSVDIWINNAGVGAFGEFTKTPMDVHEQVIKTNLLGYMYGAYIVVPYFKDQGRGTLINNISLGAFIAHPFTVAYSASKFGLRGFSEALRSELLDFKNVHICDVYPAFIDTPGMHHGANYSGKVLRPIPPVSDPFLVARAIVSLSKHPRTQVMVGPSGRIARLAHALAPKLMSHVMNKIVTNYLQGAKGALFTSGNLFKPVFRGAGTHGGWNLKTSFKRLIERT